MVQFVGLAGAELGLPEAAAVVSGTTEPRFCVIDMPSICPRPSPIDTAATPATLRRAVA